MHGCTCDASPGGPSPGSLDIADIIERWGPELRRLQPLSREQSAALRDIERCRTAALGGHLDVCANCGDARPSYNSCRNRHCPKCQALRQAHWVDSRVARTLPTHHFHVVFTLPAELRPLAGAHPEFIYDLLFDCASATLLELGRDRKQLGGQLGITAVLHTWTRDLALHPHLHCIVTGGGLSHDGGQWRAARANFLFHVNVMRELFRGKFLDGLLKARDGGRLLRSDGSPCFEPPELRRLVRRLRRMKWVVYCKRPFGGPEQVIRYLGQYTHRVAISNHRLVSIEPHAVTFRTRDGKTASLPPVEFLGRFIAHVLPSRFVKIRHYGLLAMRSSVGGSLATCLPRTTGRPRRTHSRLPPRMMTAGSRGFSNSPGSMCDVVPRADSSPWSASPLQTAGRLPSRRQHDHPDVACAPRLRPRGPACSDSLRCAAPRKSPAQPTESRGIR